MTDLQSHLARYVSKPATDDGELKRMGARAWVTHETLVVRLSAVSDPIIRGMIVAVAHHAFGKKHADE